MKKELLTSLLFLLITSGIMAQDVNIDASLATTIQNSLNAGNNYTLTATGYITVNANILKSSGTSATLTLKATKSIIVKSGYSIASSSNALNMVFWSRSGGNNAGDDGITGCVWFLVGSSVTTNGGNMVIGGGVDPNSGYCVGDVSYTSPSENNANYRGVTINGTIAAGGGNILIKGRGPISGAGAARGVSVGGAISTAGSGIVTITGQAVGVSDGLAFGDGSVAGTTGTLTSGSGNVSLTGVKATGSNGINLAPFSGATSYINCGGNLAINSTGNINAVNGYIVVAGSYSISAGTSNITLTNSNNDFTGNVSVSSGTDLTLIDKNAISLGTISINGLLSAKTLSGNLSITNSITTANTTTSAIKLYADYYKTAGDASGGNILVSGSPVITSGTGGRTMLYTGSISGSTGLSGIVNDSRYFSDYTTATFYPSLGTGVYGIYREAGALLWVGGAAGNTTDWNTTGNWSPAAVPTAGYNVTIPSGTTYNPHVTSAVSSPAVCNNLTIASGTELTLDAGKALTVNGIFINNAGNSGLVIENGASLIHSTSGVASTVTSEFSGPKWHFISSPVAGATSDMYSGKYLQTLHEDTQTYSDIIDTDVPLTPAQGFAAWSPEAGFSLNYTGNLNTGNISFSTTAGSYTAPEAGFNLVGNPYPCSLDWTLCSRTNLNNAIYIEKDGQWATYVGGVGENGGTKYIAPGQGFLVQATAVGSVLMSNAAKSHNATTFFKDQPVVPNMIRLELSGNGYKDETVVRFTPEATEAFDGEYDALKMYSDNVQIPHIYSIGGTQLAINSMPETNMVPVGVKTGSTGTYAIEATEINNMPYVTLEDTKTGIFTPLANSPYIFTYEAGENELRFNLHFNMMLGITDSKDISATVYSYRKTAYIHVNQQAKANIDIYSISGQLVASKPATSGMNEIKLSQTGNYIVKIISEKTIQVKKIFIH